MRRGALCWSAAAGLLSSATLGQCTTLIVELISTQGLGRHADNILATCKSSHMDWAIRHELNSKVFSGFAVEFDALQEDLAPLKACLSSDPNVIAIWNAPLYGLASVSERQDGGGEPLEALVSTAGLPGSYNSSVSAADLPHSMTGVDKLHDHEIDGRGARIGMVDSGVDYLHRAFGGGGYGPNHTVSFGLDLAGDGLVADVAPVLDSDPYVECSFHGTHTTGIAAGRDETVGFVGVAPGAQIEHFRISGCVTKAHFPAGVVIQGILAAYNRGVDVISLSLTTMGGPYPDEAVSEILTRIAREDKTVVVVANGNNGHKGPFSSDAPGSAGGIISVGSIKAQRLLQSNPRAQFSIDGANALADLRWAPGTPTRFPTSLPLYALTWNISTEADACQPLRNNLSLSGSVVLVRRGGCLFSQKMANLVLGTGARYALIYDNVTTDTVFEFDNNFADIAGVGSVTAQDGEKLVHALSQGKKVEMLMDSNFTLMPYLSAQDNSRPIGEVSPFSSWGPTGSLEITPHVMAPGQGIWSSVPRSWGGYHIHSGTSQAAPYISGCVALLRQACPHLSASQIVRRLRLSGTPLRFNDGTNKSYSILAPSWQQGSGLVNASAAVHLQSDVEPASLSFNDTEHFTAKATFRISNQGKSAVVYEFHSVPAATVAIFEARNRSFITPWSGRNVSSSATAGTTDVASLDFLDNILDIYAEIIVEPHRLRVLPGESMTVTVAAKIDDLRYSRDRCPLYSGFIIGSNGRGEKLTIPYGGLACQMSDVAALPYPQTFLATANYSEVAQFGGRFTPVAEDTKFSLPKPGSAAPRLKSTMQYPVVNVQLAIFSHQVDVFLLPEGQAAYMGGEKIMAYPADLSTSRPGGISRVVTSHMLWRGELTNGSWAGAGHYRFNVCAARAWSRKVDCQKTVSFELSYEP